MLDFFKKALQIYLNCNLDLFIATKYRTLPSLSSGQIRSSFLLPYYTDTEVSPAQCLHTGGLNPLDGAVAVCQWEAQHMFL